MLSPDSWNWMKLNADTTEAEEKEKDCHVFWVAIPIGQDINKIDIPDLRSTAFADSVDLWILGSANSEGKAGQPEKAAHRPWFRPTAQQCSDWTFAHLTNISYVMYIIAIHVYAYDSYDI